MSKLNFFAFLLIATVAHGEIILQPTDLNRGDQYRLVFVTTAVRDATSSDIEVYNDFVQGVADAAPIIGDWGLEWKAVVSTSEINYLENVGHDFLNDVLIYRIDGTPTTTYPGATQIFFDDADAISKTELNTTLPQESTLEIVGGSEQSGRQILWSGADLLFEEHHFYAMSEIITAVPEPSSSTLAFLGIALLVLNRRRSFAA